MIDQHNEYNELAYYTLGLQDECFIHQYIVDAFTLQTADIKTKPMRIIFSLVGLYLYIEKNYSGREVQNFHTLMSKAKMEWPICNLHNNKGDVNVSHVLKKSSDNEKYNMIEEWCKSVWQAYSENHLIARNVVDHYLKKESKL
jgi:hypothetical protein